MNFDGKPTSADVRRIRGALKFSEGVIISHQQIEAIVEEDWRSQRYRTITSALRRKLKDDDIYLEALPGIGFKVLNDADRVEVFGVRKTRQGFRMIAVSHRDILTVDRTKLTDEEKINFDATKRTQLVAMNEAKNIRSLPPAPKPAAPVSHISKRLDKK